MLLSKTATIKWNGKIKKWYIEKGYTFTKVKDEFEVKIKDLTSGSHASVSVQCDGCKIVKNIEWKTYLSCLTENNNYYCQRCGTNGGTRWISFEEWCITNNRLDILNRWSKHNNKKPSEVSCYVNKKILFTCPKGQHEDELNNIVSITRQNINVICNQCNSFEQWCINNGRRDVLDRWDYELNKNITPNKISYGTKEKYWFKCPRGIHGSELKNINSFTNGQGGSMECIKCNSFAQWGIDNLGEDFLDKYWDYELNKNLDPWGMSKSANKQHIFIKCQNKDYHKNYKTLCAEFHSGKRCPYCSGAKVHFLDSLGSMYPNAISVWSDKNKQSPYTYSCGSNKDVMWKCPNNKHEDYLRSVRQSKDKDFRCPQCSHEREESLLQEKTRLYLNKLGYETKHEYGCTVVAKNLKTKANMPYDNEIVVNNKHLMIEVMGQQHYHAEGFNLKKAKRKNITKQQALLEQQNRDAYKKEFVLNKGYEYLELPYTAFDEKDTYKTLIDNKIKQILEKLNNNHTNQAS